MKHRTGGDFNTGGFLNEPGTYHLCITDATEKPENKNGSLIDNAAFRVACEVMAGTVSGQENKSVDILFFHPKPTDKNEGAFARKKIDRFLLAVNLVSDEDKDKDLDVDIAKCVGRQFVAKLEHEDENAKFLRVAFADIYHVDDPAVKSIPKNADALKLIPSAMRKIGSQPPKANGNGSGSSKKADKPAESKPPESAADEWNL